MYILLEVLSTVKLCITYSINVFYSILADHYWRMGKHNVSDKKESRTRCGRSRNKKYTKCSGYVQYLDSVRDQIIVISKKNAIVIKSKRTCNSM